MRPNGNINILAENRFVGVVPVLSFVLFAIGGTIPVVGEKGNAEIFNLPMREHLLAVAKNAAAWNWANILMGAAAIILLGGLTILTTTLEGAGERIFSRLGLLGWWLL